jgi:hypothetical protein
MHWEMHTRFPLGRAARERHLRKLRRHCHRRRRASSPNPDAPGADAFPETIRPAQARAPKTTAPKAIAAAVSAGDQAVPTLRRRRVRVLVGQEGHVQAQDEQKLWELLRVLLLRPQA